MYGYGKSSDASSRTQVIMDSDGEKAAGLYHKHQKKMLRVPQSRDQRTLSKSFQYINGRNIKQQ